MLLTIVGPGRAGMALALAAIGAGHSIAVVAGRSHPATVAAAERLETVAADLTETLPVSDVTVIAVRDDAIGQVAAGLATNDLETGGVVHVSGLAPVAELEPLAARGLPTGSFHPLQTLPNPESGAAALAGSWVAITTSDGALADRLTALATSIGARPFRLDDGLKAVYHAAAAAAANFPLAALTMAHDLFEAAGVPFEASRPLVEAVVANAYEMGPRAALTGPVARGDVGTVAAQLEAVATADPSLVPAFGAFVAELARLTGRTEAFDPVIGGGSRGAG